MRLALICALLAGCGGPEASPEPVAHPTSAGDEAVVAPEDPGPEEVADLFEVMALGPVEAARTRLLAASYTDENAERARGACLSVLEAMLAGGAETFDLERHCVDRLEQLAETTGQPLPDVTTYRAMWEQAHAARIAAQPPMPEGFSEAGERTFAGTLAEDDPRTPRDNAAYDDYPLELSAGTTMHVDMVSEEFDCYLWLFGPDGRPLAQDDDGGEGLNSRLEYTVTLGGSYVLRASAFDQRGRGAYEVQVAIGPR